MTAPASIGVLGSTAQLLWDSGEVYQQRIPFSGIAVVEGPALAAGQMYSWDVFERQVANSSGANASK